MCSGLKNAEVTGRKSWLQVPCLESLTSLLAAPPPPAVLLWSETCLRCLSRVRYVCCVVFSVLLVLKACWRACMGLGQRVRASTGAPINAHCCWRGWVPALVVSADGDLGLCLALPCTSGAASIQGEGDEESGTDILFIFLITLFQVCNAGVHNK